VDPGEFARRALAHLKAKFPNDTLELREAVAVAVIMALATR
jgi:hypothetical protein